MKFEELEVVKTKIAFPSENIKKGEVGTIVMVFAMPQEAYEVEFANSDGTTKAMFAIFPEYLERALS